MTTGRRPRSPEKRRRLDELMSVLQGDRLVVSELSRLGRSLRQIVAVLDAPAKASVAFAALKENIQVEGKSNIQTKVVTTLFALFAEVERDLISERTLRGPCPGPGPRAGSSAARKGSLGVFTARRQGGQKSSASSSWVKPSPYSVFLHESGRYPWWRHARSACCARGRRTFTSTPRYRARTWGRTRRVVIKAEVVPLKGRPPRDNPRFVVTNLRQTPRFVYEKVYCGRARRAEVTLRRTSGVS